MPEQFHIRRLDRDELVLVGAIDRTERIDALYEQHGDRLVERPGRWDAPAWRTDADADGGHTVAAKLRELQGYVDRGGIAVGAFTGGQLVGIGVVVPQFRPGLAQLAFLHVSAPWRGSGVGSRLAAELDDIARHTGASEMVVSAAPSKHTVDFYVGRGFTPMRDPVDELVLQEPDDVHLHKPL